MLFYRLVYYCSLKSRIDKPKAKSQSKAQSSKGPKKGKRNLASGLATKILKATHPPTPQLLSMQEASNKKTQRVKATQYYPLYLLSTKNTGK